MAGTDIWLQVLRPYGALLPNEATLSCLTDAIIDIGEVIAEVGDKPLHSNVTRVENDIKIFIQVLLTTDFVLSTAIAALRGVYELMIGIGGPGSRAITVVVNDQYYGTIGRIDVSSDGHASGTAPMLNDAPAMTSEAAPTTSGPGITDNEATLAARATISMTGAVANLTSANITGQVMCFHNYSYNLFLIQSQASHTGSLYSTRDVSLRRSLARRVLHVLISCDYRSVSSGHTVMSSRTNL